MTESDNETQQQPATCLVDVPEAEQRFSGLFYSAGLFGLELPETEASIKRLTSSLPLQEAENVAGLIRQIIRRHSEEVLQRMEERLQLAQEVGSIGCFEIDMRDGTSVGSPAFFEIYGLPSSKGSWSQKEWMSFVHPDDRPHVLAHLRDVVRGADVTKVEYRIVRADGETRWTASRARVETEADGRQVRAYGIQQDITDLRRAEAALVTREEMLRLSLEAVGDAAWDWDLNRGTILISGRHVKVLGYDAVRFDSSMDGFSSIVHSEDLPHVTKALRVHLAGRTKRYHSEFRLRTKNGQWRRIMSRGRVIERDPVTGWAIRMVGTTVDLEKLNAQAA